MFVQILSIFVVIVLAKVIKALIEHLQLRHKLRNFPGWKGLPIVGTPIKVDPAEFVQQIASLCYEHFESGIAKIWFGPIPVIIVFRPNTAEEVYKNQKLSTKSYFYKFLNNWLGDSLLMSYGQKWHERRRLLTPAFHFKILEQFLNVFNRQFTVLVRLLNEQIDKSPEGFDIQSNIHNCMLDNICETAMGVNIRAQEQSGGEVIRTYYRQQDILMTRAKCAWLWPDLIFRLSSFGREEQRNLVILHGFTRKVIMERKAERLNKKNADKAETSRKQATTENDIFLSKNKPRNAFLDILLEAAEENESLTDDGIQEEVDTFVFAGHDTTSTGAVWMTYMLGLFPEEQTKVFEEIDALFGDSDRAVTYEDTQKLEYTECFIKETLRLYPPVPLFYRKVSEPCEIGGYQIPTGAMVAVCTNILHRDPENFPEPEKFDPSRWLNENSSGRHPYCFTPFSAGTRNCIGQRFAMLEEKVFLCYLMRNFKVATKAKLEDIIFAQAMNSKPGKPLSIQLIKRK